MDGVLAFFPLTEDRAVTRPPPLEEAHFEETAKVTFPLERTDRLFGEVTRSCPPSRSQDRPPRRAAGTPRPLRGRRRGQLLAHPPAIAAASRLPRDGDPTHTPTHLPPPSGEGRDGTGPASPHAWRPGGRAPTQRSFAKSLRSPLHTHTDTLRLTHTHRF